MSTSNFITGFTNLQCTCVDNSNNLYVSNFDTNILKFNANTGSSILFTTTQISSVPGVIGVVTDNSNNLFTISYNNGVNKYNATTGSLIASAILPATNTPYIGCCDNNNNLYVCYPSGFSNNSGYITKYIASNSSIITYFIGRSGVNANGLYGPVGIYVDKNNILYVSNGGGANGPYYVGKYNALTGRTINATFITLSTSPGQITGDNYNNLFIATDTVVSQYNSITGELINANYATEQGNILSLSSSSSYLYFTSSVNTLAKYALPTPPILCFVEDTKILTNEGYKQIKYLKSGDLIKTTNTEYIPIFQVSKREMQHNAINERIKNQLYKCSPEKYPDLFEELIITGCHSILVDDFVNEEEKNAVIRINGDTYVTDKKYRLPACVDERATVYEKPGTYTIYHIALEHQDEYMNYGIYANGLLVESSSKIHLSRIFYTF